MTNISRDRPVGRDRASSGCGRLVSATRGTARGVDAVEKRRGGIASSSPGAGHPSGGGSRGGTKRARVTVNMASAFPPTEASAGVASEKPNVKSGGVVKAEWTMSCKVGASGETGVSTMRISRVPVC